MNNPAYKLPDPDYRIYVASLSDYNSGILHGAWIDCDGKTVEELETETNAMLANSKAPNVWRVRCTACDTYSDVPHDTDWHKFTESAVYDYACPCCGIGARDDQDKTTYAGPFPSAEEYAIHDFEGFGNLIGEYSSLREVAAIVEALESADDPLALQEFAEYYGYALEEAAEHFEDAYYGQWDSELQFAENFIDDCGILSDMPDNLQCYFDYDAYTRDLFMDGFTMTESGYVFSNNH